MGVIEAGGRCQGFDKGFSRYIVGGWFEGVEDYSQGFYCK